MNVIEIKKQYNALLERHKKAVAFMEDPLIPMEKKEEQLSRWYELLQDLNKTCHLLELEGEKYQEFAVKGFDIGQSNGG